MPVSHLSTQNFELDTIPCVDLTNPNSDELFTYNQHWLMARLDEGMDIIKMDSGTTAFIEYIPTEYSWKPVLAPGYALIHHVFAADEDDIHMVKFELIEKCEAENSEKNGVVLMLRKEEFNAEQDFYMNMGYLVYDERPGFTLLAKKFRPQAKSPHFIRVDEQETPPPSLPHSITIKYADQSAFINYYIYEMKKDFQDMGFSVELRKLTSAAEARESGSPYGTFGVFLDGHYLCSRLMNRQQIETLIGDLDLFEVYPEINDLKSTPLYLAF